MLSDESRSDGPEVEKASEEEVERVERSLSLSVHANRRAKGVFAAAGGGNLVLRYALEARLCRQYAASASKTELQIENAVWKGGSAVL